MPFMPTAGLGMRSGVLRYGSALLACFLALALQALFTPDVARGGAPDSPGGVSSGSRDPASSQSRVTGEGRLVFERWRRGGGPFVVTSAPDGTDRTILTRGDGPRWSPNGRRIAYTHGRAIWIMRADGSNKHRVLDRAFLPSWSPDGRKLLVTRGAFWYSWRFGVLNLRTRNVRWYRFGGVGWDWSWRTRRIVFTREVGVEENYDIFTVKPGFTNRVNVTNTPRLHENVPRWAPAGADRVAFDVQSFGPGWDNDPCAARTVVLDTATGTRTRVRCDAGSPTWSPDATTLVISQHIWDSADNDLTIVDVATGAGTVIVPHTTRWQAAQASDWRAPR